MHVAIYIRKSRHDRGKAEPRLEMQRSKLPLVAQEMGCTGYEIYDDGHNSASKKNLKNLTERNRLKQDIKNGKIDVVLVIEISRLSRDDSMTDFTSFLDLCKDHQVQLAIPGRTLNPASTGDWTLLTIEGTLASAEMKKTIERMGQGASQAYLNGKYAGGGVPAPYVLDKKLHRPVVDQVALLACQHLWCLAETHSAKAIAEILNVPYSRIRRAISDERLDYLQAQRRDRENGELIKCEWEPVMSADQAVRIRSARRTRKTNGNSTKPASLLSGLNILKCGYCGNTAKTWCNGKTRRDGTKLKYYGCNTKNSGEACIKSRTMPQLILDDKVLTNLFNTIGCLEELMGHWLSSQQNAGLSEKLKVFEAEERELKKKIDRLTESVASGVFSIEQAGKAMKGIKQRQADIHAEVLKLEDRNAPVPDWASLLLTRNEFEHLDFFDQRRFIELVVDEIRVYDRYAIVTYKFPRTATGDCNARIQLPPPQRGTSWGRKPRFAGSIRSKT